MIASYGFSDSNVAIEPYHERPRRQRADAHLLSALRRRGSRVRTAGRPTSPTTGATCPIRTSAAPSSTISPPRSPIPPICSDRARWTPRRPGASRMSCWTSSAKGEIDAQPRGRPDETVRRTPKLSKYRGHEMSKQAFSVAEDDAQEGRESGARRRGARGDAGSRQGAADPAHLHPGILRGCRRPPRSCRRQPPTAGSPRPRQRAHGRRCRRPSRTITKARRRT